ncbi:MAG: hypothetical protein IJU51_03305 [Clostridia bacterium]|nr:hypothetical protein [Clostridia bacterium]
MLTDISFISCFETSLELSGFEYVPADCCSLDDCSCFEGSDEVTSDTGSEWTSLLSSSELSSSELSLLSCLLSGLLSALLSAELSVLFSTMLSASFEALLSAGSSRLLSILLSVLLSGLLSLPADDIFVSTAETVGRLFGCELSEEAPPFPQPVRNAAVRAAAKIMLIIPCFLIYNYLREYRYFLQ